MALVLLTAAVLERAVFSQLRIGGAAADVLLLLAISAGMVGGPDRGAVIGFFAGLVLDLLVQSPLGLYALVYCVVGYIVGVAHTAVVRSSRWEPMLLAFLASVVGIGLYVVASFMVGRSGLLNGHLLVVMAVVSVANAVLVPVTNRALRWALGDLSGSRAAVR
ncbi:MAG TPA: rod shape-determining protein MreD [Acidimicrobiales bacterium]